jgi:hypothetical protein
MPGRSGRIGRAVPCGSTPRPAAAAVSWLMQKSCKGRVLAIGAVGQVLVLGDHLAGPRRVGRPFGRRSPGCAVHLCPAARGFCSPDRLSAPGIREMMPVIGSDTKRRSPWKFAMSWPFKAVVLCFTRPWFWCIGARTRWAPGSRLPAPSARGRQLPLLRRRSTALFGGASISGYFRPDFLRCVLSHITACHEGFAQRKLLLAFF